MGFALAPGEAPLHFSRSKNVMHVAIMIINLNNVYTVNRKNGRKPVIIRRGTE